jgi:CubicO group peptidase (beta-lactamase class C family)
MSNLLAQLASRPRVRHAVVGAASLDGEWHWSGAVGEARPQGDPMSTSTPWFLASVTKLYIAGVILVLHEKGLVDLARPILDYLPESLTRGLHTYRDREHTHQITITHLLGHLSGLPDSLDERPKGGRGLLEEAVEEGDRSWSFEEAILRARDDLTPHFPPSDPQAERARIRYSDTNYQLLMVIAQNVTGRPIEQLYGDFIFRPLGLGQTWRPGDLRPESAGEPATVWVGNTPLVDRPLMLASTGDLYATVDDVLEFGRAFFTGRFFADSETARILIDRFRRFGLPHDMVTVRAPSWPIEYGLGVMRFQISRWLAGGRRIPGLIGHTGSTGSWLWFCPELELLIAGTVDQTMAPTVPFRIVPRYVAGMKSE